MNDPGWRRAAPLAIPMFPGRYMRLGSLTGLEVLRGLWLSFFFVSIGIIGITAAMFPANRPSTAALLVMVGLGVTSEIAIVVVGHLRALDTSSAAALGSSYRTRFFTCGALAQSAVLVGFLLCALDESMWLALIGGAFTWVGLLLVAPTRRRIEHEQRRLSQSANPLVLIESLGRAPEAPS